MYVGLAIRMAHQLSLNTPLPVPPRLASNAPINRDGEKELEIFSRESLNRSRTWLVVYNLDLSLSGQFGKPPTLREDFLVRQSDTFYKPFAPYSHPFDVHLGRYTQLLRVVSEFYASVYETDPGPDRDEELARSVRPFDRYLIIQHKY